MQSNYLVFFLLCTVPLLGQSEEEIMQNADITWAAIHYQDIELDDGITYPNPPYILPEDPEKKDAYVRAYSAKTNKARPEYFTPSQPRRRFDLLKYTPEAYPTFLGNKPLQTSSIISPLATYIKENAYNPSFKIYKDAELQEPLEGEQARAEALNKIIVSFDPQTFEEIHTSKPLTEAFSFMRLRLLLYYNQKENRFYSKVIAAAPLYGEKSSRSAPSFETLFWIPVQNVEQYPDLQDANIPFAQQSYFNQDVYYLRPDSLLKSKRSFAEAKALLMEDYLKNERPQEEEEAYRSILSARPSEHVRHQEGELELLRFDRNNTKEELLQHFAWLKFNRIWAWDNQNKQLLSYTYSFSPVMGFYDLTSGFPLFQRYYPYVEER